MRDCKVIGAEATRADGLLFYINVLYEERLQMTYRKHFPGVFVMICLLFFLAGCEGGSLTSGSRGLVVAGEPVQGYAWSTTTGWINFNPDGYPGVRFHRSHFSGEAWAEGVGWISFGSETCPNDYYDEHADQRAMSSLSGQDCWGVLNRYVDASGDYLVDASGDVRFPDFETYGHKSSHLEGFAFNTGTGWINFMPIVPKAEKGNDSTQGVAVNVNQPNPGGDWSAYAVLRGNAWAAETGWIYFRHPHVDASGNVPPLFDKDGSHDVSILPVIVPLLKYDKIQIND